MPKITNHKVIGPLDLKDLESLLENEYEFLDISEAEMGIDEEHQQYFILPQLETITSIRQGDKEIKPCELLEEVYAMAYAE